MDISVSRWENAMEDVDGRALRENCAGKKSLGIFPAEVCWKIVTEPFARDEGSSFIRLDRGWLVTPHLNSIIQPDGYADLSDTTHKIRR